MGELLPCPFCGGDAEINQIGNEATKTRGYEVKCSTFGCSTTKRGMVVKHTLAKAREWAVERWNTRPRTEGRGEPVAWQEAAEPFFRLAREVINPVNGERSWHADSKDWMVVFSFAGQSVTLGDLRRAAAVQASGDREGNGTERPVIAGEGSRDEPPSSNLNEESQTNGS